MQKMARPSNTRGWSADQAVLATAQSQGSLVQLRNVRNCHYLEAETYLVSHYDRVYDLRNIRTVDFVIVPFKDTPSIAHTMLCFGFQDPSDHWQYVAVSVEVRKEDGETYAAWKGFARQYELMYVVADENDVLNLRVNHRGEDVYLYPSTATPDQARDLFVDVLERANQLARAPEFYNTITNNCTINIVRHINRLRPGRVRYDYRVLLPGHSDRLAYDLDLIERHGTFAETKQLAYINPLAARLKDDPHFSEKLRAMLAQRVAERRVCRFVGL